MKISLKYFYIIILCNTSHLLSCSKDKSIQCGPPCFDTHDVPGFIISISDSLGNNLLKPGIKNNLTVDKIIFKTGENLDFILSDSVNQYPTGYYYLYSIDDDYYSLCIGKECELYIQYKNLVDVDTLDIMIDKNIHYLDSCYCVYTYTFNYIKFNGNKVTQFETEHYTGAAILVK